MCDAASQSGHILLLMLTATAFFCIIVVITSMIMVSRGLSLSRNILRGLRGLRVRQTRLASTPASGGGFGPPKPTPSIFEQAKLNDMKTIQESYSQIQRGAVSDGKERSSSVLEDTVQFPSAFTIKVRAVPLV